MKKVYSILFTIIVISSMTICQSCRNANTIQQANSLLWENPDSCLVYISSVEARKNTYESKRIELIYQHALYKITGQVENDSSLLRLADYFLNKKEYRDAGEVYYILGASNIQLGEYFDGTHLLKKAERLLLQSNSCDPTLLGMVYFNLGIAAEQSRLFDVAHDYCQQAVPYLQKVDKPAYLAVCYHLLGKSSNDKLSKIAYLDSAINYAAQCTYSVYLHEIEVTKHHVLYPGIYDIELYKHLQYLCDSIELNSYCAEMVSYQLYHRNITCALEYLNKLAIDTSFSIWQKEQYHSLKAEYLSTKNNPEEAYRVMKQLHEWQTQEIEQSAYASTYIIAQKYEAAKEQELRQMETIKKQKAYIWISLLIIACLIIGGAGQYFYTKTKQELEVHRLKLKTQIRTRVSVARSLHKWASRQSVTLPEELNLLSPMQAASDRKNWIEFYNEFNFCYDNLLQHIKEQHTEVTESDLQFIALAFLGINTTDISFLLGINKQTVWNRRSILKQHLQLPQDTDLDEWIAEHIREI